MENANALGWILLAVAVVFVLRTIRTETRRFGKDVRQLRTEKRSTVWLGTLWNIGFIGAIIYLFMNGGTGEQTIVLIAVWFVGGAIIARKMR